MAQSFYDVKERKKIEVDEKNITKTKFERKLKDGGIQTRYAFIGKIGDRKLMKFCSKADWDASKAKEEK